MAIVKADAYGHGSVEIADIAVANGADYLGVAWVSEAVALREAGIKAPILILSEPTINVAADIVRLEVTQTVYSYNFAHALSEAATEMGRTARIHIKIDTGMNRIGVKEDQAIELVESIHQLRNILIEGIFTHCARADELGDDYTLTQMRDFKKIVEALEDKGYHFPIRHMANTAATLNFPQTHMDMVRIGIGSFDNVLTFKSKVAYIKRVPPGSYVSYGGTYQTKRSTTIATISAGYADGLIRSLSNKGAVLINGKRYPIVGRVCMDMTMIDMGDDYCSVGEEAVLMGHQGVSSIPVDEVAQMTDTISYEVLCGIGKRVNRIYLY